MTPPPSLLEAHPEPCQCVYPDKCFCSPGAKQARWRKDHERADGTYDAEMWGVAESESVDE